jgi:uncharacterized protein (TIGR00288 family)
MPNPSPTHERSLAVFIDLENLALGFPKGGKERFQISRVLERLVEKGKLIAKKAYADWSRFPDEAKALHEAAIELIDIPKRAQTGKNSADIRLVVDAMDLSWSKPHVDTFVVVSGDSDFSPLVSKLKENGKHVIGVGMRDATSQLLASNCDEFLVYEDLSRAAAAQPTTASLEGEVPAQARELFDLLLSSLAALRRENYDTLYASMVKDTMRRKRPSFDEGSYGYRSFTDLLEDAARLGLVHLERDTKQRTLVVTEGPGGQTPPSPPVTGGTKPLGGDRGRRRRR